MFNSILVLTDNVQMAGVFINTAIELKLEDKFNFGISPFSNLSDFNKFGIEFKTYDLRNQEDIDNIVLNFDLIFSIHCKQFFPKKIVETVKCINVHPGYNPYNRGWYPQVFAIINKTILGATIHEIDVELDNGKIIDREIVPLLDSDTSLTAYNKVLDKEKLLLERNLKSICSNSYEVTDPEFKGDLNLKKDFNNLKEIKLKEKATYGEVINHLRAMNHGDYLNAYFFNNEGKRVYLKLDLILEK